MISSVILTYYLKNKILSVLRMTFKLLPTAVKIQVSEEGKAAQEWCHLPFPEHIYIYIYMYVYIYIYKQFKEIC